MVDPSSKPMWKNGKEIKPDRSGRFSNNLIGDNETHRPSEADLEARQRILLEKERTLKMQVEELRAELGRVSVAEYPIAKVISDRLEQWLSPHGMPIALLPSAIPPWSRGTQAPTTIDITPADLPGRLFQERHCGLSPQTMMAVDVHLRAGELVFLIGDDAGLYLQRYASAISGEQLFFMQPDPSTIGLDDLWRVPGNQLPTALARAWQQAIEQPGRLFLVWLHSVDTSPWHLWLEALVMVLNSPVRPGNLLLACTFSAAASFSRLSDRFLNQLPFLVSFLPANIYEADCNDQPEPTSVFFDEETTDDLEHAIRQDIMPDESRGEYLRRLRLRQAYQVTADASQDSVPQILFQQLKEEGAAAFKRLTDDCQY